MLLTCTRSSVMMKPWKTGLLEEDWIKMTIKNAEFEDMKRLGHIMSVSFRTAFRDFISRETLEACAQEENCAALLEGIFREGHTLQFCGETEGKLPRLLYSLPRGEYAPLRMGKKMI